MSTAASSTTRNRERGQAMVLFVLILPDGVGA